MCIGMTSMDDELFDSKIFPTINNRTYTTTVGQIEEKVHECFY